MPKEYFDEFILELAEDHELVEELKNSLNAGIIKLDESGHEVFLVKKVQVDRFMGLKIEIFANEHPPPHFRVKRQNSTANFRISDCSCINGQGEVLGYERNIYKWWKKNKPKLIEIWNERRPDDCPVGEYKEE